jgi:hypothetical protein
LKLGVGNWLTIGFSRHAHSGLSASPTDRFPKHIYHSIICIGALVAHHEDSHWTVAALGAPHVGERSEKALISAFVDRSRSYRRTRHVQRVVV